MATRTTRAGTEGDGCATFACYEPAGHLGPHRDWEGREIDEGGFVEKPTGDPSRRSFRKAERAPSNAVLERAAYRGATHGITGAADLRGKAVPPWKDRKLCDHTQKQLFQGGLLQLYEAGRTCSECAWWLSWRTDRIEPGGEEYRPCDPPCDTRAGTATWLRRWAQCWQERPKVMRSRRGRPLSYWLLFARTHARWRGAGANKTKWTHSDMVCRLWKEPCVTVAKPRSPPACGDCTHFVSWKDPERQDGACAAHENLYTPADGAAVDCPDFNRKKPGGSN